MCLEISRQPKGPATVFFKARSMFSKNMGFRACAFVLFVVVVLNLEKE